MLVARLLMEHQLLLQLLVVTRHSIEPQLDRRALYHGMFAINQAQQLLPAGPVKRLRHLLQGTIKRLHHLLQGLVKCLRYLLQGTFNRTHYLLHGLLSKCTV